MSRQGRNKTLKTFLQECPKQQHWRQRVVQDLGWVCCFVLFVGCLVSLFVCSMEDTCVGR